MPFFKPLPSILTLLGALSVASLLVPSAQAQNKGDDSLLEMHQAFRKNDRTRLSALLPQVQGHTLEPLAAYWELRVRLDTAPEAEIERFLAKYAGSYYEDRLRNDWLLQAGRRRDWTTVANEHPKYRMGDDRELRCYALAADAILRKTDVATKDAAGELRRAVEFWTGMCQIDFSLDAEVERLMSLDPDVGEAVLVTSLEVISNAIRHGKATTMTLAITLASVDLIRIVGTNNGAAVATPSPGLGMSMFDELTAYWSLESDDHTTFTGYIAARQPASSETTPTT